MLRWREKKTKFIRIDPDDLPTGSSQKPGARSTIHGAGELHSVARIGEFPGVMRYEDAKSQGKNAKFNARKRLDHEKSVREFFNKRSYNAEGDFLVRDRVKAKPTSREQKILKALGISAGAVAAIYGGRRLKRWWKSPADWSKLTPAQSKHIAKMIGPERYARLQQMFSRGSKHLIVPGNSYIRKSPRVYAGSIKNLRFTAK